MAREKEQKNGRLKEAIAILIQNQAFFIARISEMDRINTERFARIEALLLEHNRILAERARILQALPDAVRERMGFRVSEQREGQ